MVVYEAVGVIVIAIVIALGLRWLISNVRWRDGQ